jgi:hypothetical protein
MSLYFLELMRIWIKLFRSIHIRIQVSLVPEIILNTLQRLMGPDSDMAYILPVFKVRYLL